LPVSPPVPSSNWDRGPALLKKTGDRRIVATALAAPKMAAPRGMRLALVHLVGLRNRVLVFDLRGVRRPASTSMTPQLARQSDRYFSHFSCLGT
jgi:hypothetical protein